MGARAMRYFWASVTDLVGVTGFEPATSWSQTTRSTKLSYTPKLNVDSYHESGLFASRNLVTLEKLEMKTGKYLRKCFQALLLFQNSLQLFVDYIVN